MLRILLFPFSMLYGLIVTVRNFLFEIKILETTNFDLPVICVGNITIGGTGKTPHVEYLIRLIRGKRNLAVLSRGYKRKTKGFIIADINSNSADIGDEPKQIKSKFSDITVAVDENRVHGVRELIKEKIDTVILDDAFQHRHIKAGLSILLVDYNRNINSDFLLPYGRLREPVSGKDRADIIIVSKTPENLKPIDRRLVAKNLQPRPYQSMYFSSLKYGKLIPVFSEIKSAAPNWEPTSYDYSVVLVTGIARSQQLYNHVKNGVKEIIHLNFPDHASFSNKKIKQIFQAFESIKNDHKIIITTEKDAVKIREIAELNQVLKSNIYYLPVEVYIIDKEEEFRNQILDFVG